MLQSASTFRLLLVLLTAVAAPAQTSGGTGAAMPRNAIQRHRAAPPAAQSFAAGSDPAVIYLDPAHGGPDAGTHLQGNAFEKDATLALALKLRTLLGAHGFKVVMTRSAASDNITVDQRIDLANRSQASACLLLHASNGGHGVHLFISSLTAPGQVAHTRATGDSSILPWDTAQAPSLALSLDLESNLASALNGIRIPLVTGRASISPIDSMVCPAVAVELAPYTPDGQAALDPADNAYQQRVAEAIATALVFRREHLQSARGVHGRQTAVPHPATAKPKTPALSHPARLPAKAASIHPPASRFPAHSHGSGPGVRKLPGSNSPTVPATPNAKPKAQGAGL